MSSLDDAIATAVAAAVRTELREAVRTEMGIALKAIIPDLLAAVAAAPAQKKRMTISEALELLPGGCRTARILSALSSGALRGEQQPGGRRTWVVDADDVRSWDARGRPTIPEAVASPASAHRGVKSRKNPNKSVDSLPAESSAVQHPCNISP